MYDGPRRESRAADATTHKGATRPTIELSKRCVGEAKRREAARHRHRQHTSVGQRFVGVKGLSVRVRVETIGMGTVLGLVRLGLRLVRASRQQTPGLPHVGKPN